MHHNTRNRRFSCHHLHLHLHVRDARHAKDTAVIATARIHGRNRVIARGWSHHHQLSLTFNHARHGRYRVTMLEVKQGHPTVIGHTTLTVSRPNQPGPGTGSRAKAERRGSLQPRRLTQLDDSPIPVFPHGAGVVTRHRSPPLSTTK